MILVIVIGLAALVTAFVICLFGCFGVIKEPPDAPPYSYLLPSLIFGGGGFAILGTLILSLSKR